ncbi:uncharacterized protein LOC132744830 [Ruditapes philippinarum]|uniref:uncharacterized protein LOC132744830 n=1 Tax=Ruditapes philippinarum TaxID=129788 RepID=UPI00295AEDAE|nr:uncharacterized protein LOC132744830 [Ruditapes philippinarum]XP_060589610.1 uncharacterized protein LOC132744830 [Ruditapes philippinarum]
MSEHCALPPLSRNDSFIAPKSRRNSRRGSIRQKDNQDNTPVTRFKELVSEDVYLMDNKTRKINTNLLANSLTARLRRNLPDGTVENETIQKLRRDSLKDFVHLDNLEKQYASELSRESSRLDKESLQVLKRQKQMQRQSEVQKRKLDRLESSMRSRSGLSSASLFPLIMTNGTDSVEQETETFPQFASVDKDDQSHVKVFKLNGIYQPTNKYSSRIEPLDISPRDKPAIKENNIQESLKLADTGSPSDLSPKSRMSKKGLRVSWSRQSKYYPDGRSEVDNIRSPSVADTRADTRMSQYDVRSDANSPDREKANKTPTKRTFNSRLSFRSDTFLLQSKLRPKGRRKIETIGLKWKIPPGVDAHQIIEEAPPRPTVKAGTQRLSHNLMPVTTALAKEGMSTKKTCWQVKKVQSLSTIEMYKAWLEKLEMLKNNESRDRTRNLHSRATVMTQPV